MRGKECVDLMPLSIKLTRVIERRKAFAQVLGPSRVDDYRPQIVHANRNFLLQTLEEPESVLSHGRTSVTHTIQRAILGLTALNSLAGSFILDIAYGLNIKSKGDRYIVQAERAMEAMASSATGSRYMIDYFPVLRFLPSWFPGLHFKKDGAAWKPYVDAMPRDCLDFSENAVVSHSFNLS